LVLYPYRKKTGTNDKGSSYSVNGIGIDKAAKLPID
jgi:hypothetical protein